MYRDVVQWSKILTSDSGAGSLPLVRLAPGECGPRRAPAPDQRRESSRKGNWGLCSRAPTGQPLLQLIDQQILKGYRSYLANRKEYPLDG